MFYEVILTLLAALLSTATSVSAKNLLRLFKKVNIMKEDEQQKRLIAEKINKLNASLEHSSLLMAEIEADFAKQKELAEKWKEQAQLSQTIANMNEKEIEAIRKVLGGEIEKSSQKSNRTSFLQGAFFCILGIIGGYILGRIR